MTSNPKGAQTMFNYRTKINHSQKVLTASQYKELVKNFQYPAKDYPPVVKFFDPQGGSTWLLSELDPETGMAFGLCDLGMGSPELGYVSLIDLVNHQFNHMLGIERDLWFNGDKPMSHYIDLAKEKGSLAGV
jgi:hypothetical protein